VVAALRKAGFEVARIKGSHHFLRHADGRGSVVPVHSGETISWRQSSVTATSNAMTSSYCCSGRCFRASNFRFQPTALASLAAAAEPCVRRQAEASDN